MVLQIMSLMYFLVRLYLNGIYRTVKNRSTDYNELVGRHSTEVALALLTKLSRVKSWRYQKIISKSIFWYYYWKKCCFLEKEQYIIHIVSNKDTLMICEQYKLQGPTWFWPRWQRAIKKTRDTRFEPHHSLSIEWKRREMKKKGWEWTLKTI